MGALEELFEDGWDSRQEAFIKFMEHVLNVPEDSYVSLDGKTLAR